MVPIDVEVFLIGFDARGGYAHAQDPAALSALLEPLSRHCPHSLESGEELGVCFTVNYEVLGPEELGGEVRAWVGGGVAGLGWGG